MVSSMIHSCISLQLPVEIRSELSGTDKVGWTFTPDKARPWRTSQSKYILAFWACRSVQVHHICICCWVQLAAGNWFQNLMQTAVDGPSIMFIRRKYWVLKVFLQVRIVSRGLYRLWQRSQPHSRMLFNDSTLKSNFLVGVFIALQHRYSKGPYVLLHQSGKIAFQFLPPSR